MRTLRWAQARGPTYRAVGPAACAEHETGEDRLAVRRDLEQPHRPREQSRAVVPVRHLVPATVVGLGPSPALPPVHAPHRHHLGAVDAVVDLAPATATTTGALLPQAADHLRRIAASPALAHGLAHLLAVSEIAFRRGDGRRDAAGALSAPRDPQKALTSPHRSVGCSIPPPH